MNATELVDKMLETQHDAHIKSYERIQKWDGAHKTYGELLQQKTKALDLFRELGTALGYERQLAYLGIEKEDVESRIYGAQVGATDNFKGTETGKKCKNPNCNPFAKYDQERSMGNESAKALRLAAQGQSTCPDCAQPLSEVPVPINPSRLRGHYANYIMGVRTNDGRTHWFKEPVKPKHQQGI